MGLCPRSTGAAQQAREAQHIDMGCRQKQDPWHHGIGVFWTFHQGCLD